MSKTAKETGEQGTLVTDNMEQDGSGPIDYSSPTVFSPGGSDTPQEDATQTSHGQESYPGVRPGGLYNTPGQDPPPAGDVDPDSTNSATETGQDGDLNDVNKKKAFNYNG